MNNQHEYRLRRQSLAPKTICECGCGETIPSINYNNKPMRYKKGHGNFGIKNNFWKGGVRYSWNGYLEIKIRKYHPFKKKDGYVKLHRLVYERYYNCILLPWIEIHHINGIKTDNHKHNLLPVTKSQHSVISGTKDMSNRYCLLCGGKSTVRKNGHKDWYRYNNGFICNKCKMKIYHKETGK